MAGSLLLGLGTLPANADAALVLLSDQALVNGQDLDRLVSAWRGQPHRPAAAAYDDQRGVPAIIPARYWSSLRTLGGDRGAGPWLNALRSRVTEVKMPRAAFDVDTPNQLAGLRLS